ncbi:hypothetical protein OTU49_010301 [Cherax quadricarinatus]|uniref:Uncharacterized protein n=1 Tax=Cherax quadricarinatus TaxID=27406 RepID=A0AAW0WFU8_CHEQU|nr:uncharacterized protein LOC128702704 isoform X2 [Cherax quadricarinatus]
MKRMLKVIFWKKKTLLTDYGPKKTSNNDEDLTQTVLLLEKEQEKQEEVQEEEQEELSQVVSVINSEVWQEQRLPHHQHTFHNSTLANFIRRRRKEMAIIRRFEMVEDQVKAKDPTLAENLQRLRQDHLAYTATWCRFKYHPRLLKVDPSHPQNTTGPRLNLIWRERLEVSEKERLQRLQELEDAREAFRKEMEKSLKSNPSTGNSRLFQTPKGRGLGTVSSRLQGRRRPSAISKALNEGSVIEDFTSASSGLPTFSSALRRGSLPPPYSALQRSERISMQDYKKSKVKAVTKVKPFNFDSSSKKHSCTVHYHFHH